MLVMDPAFESQERENSIPSLLSGTGLCYHNKPVIVPLEGKQVLNG